LALALRISLAGLPSRAGAGLRPATGICQLALIAFVPRSGFGQFSKHPGI
jgi:hypothetical protein